MVPANSAAAPRSAGSSSRVPPSVRAALADALTLVARRGCGQGHTFDHVERCPRLPACPVRSSPSSARRRCCACSVRGPPGWPSCPGRWACPSRRCTGSCAPCAASGSSSRTRRPAATGSVPDLTDLGSGGVDGNVLRSRAMNWTDQLAARTRLAVQRGGAARRRRRAGAPRVPARRRAASGLATGELRPLHATALGKVLLAHVPGTAPARSLPLVAVQRGHPDRPWRPARRAGRRTPARAGPSRPVSTDPTSRPSPHRSAGTGGLTVAAASPCSGPRSACSTPPGAARRGLVEQTRAHRTRGDPGAGGATVSTPGTGTGSGSESRRARGRVVAAIDQGTTSTRCLLFDHGGRMVSVAQLEHHQYFPQPGWVEHDAAEIWRNTQRVVRDALRGAGLGPSDVAAVGIANQRETTVVWDRRTGVPVHRAITWQDTRTAAAGRADPPRPRRRGLSRRSAA